VAGGHPGSGNGSRVGTAVTGTWEIPCSAEEVGRARRALGRLLAHRGVDPDDRDAVLLVAHELVMNGVEHGGSAVRLTTAVHAGAVVLEVHDGCAVPPRLQPVDATAPRGRGLQMVAGLAARWGWFPDGAGKTVWAEVPLNGHLGPESGPAV
jgi:anti-sigma regulatory factor (Ser/Thr protein kinase)